MNSSRQNIDNRRKFFVSWRISKLGLALLLLLYVGQFSLSLIYQTSFAQAETTTSSSRAIDRSAEVLGHSLGALYQTVELDFPPVSMFVMQESAKGEIKQYQALALPLKDSAQPHSFRHVYAVGALVPLKDFDPQESFHYTFFLLGRDGSFASSPVRKVSYGELRANSHNSAMLSRENVEVSTETDKKKGQSRELDLQAKQLREQALSLAGVQEIIDLELRKQILQEAVNEKKAELERVSALTERGRRLPEPEDINVLRQDLALQLKEAAQVTALADRLNRRRREAAVQSFRSKLNLVEETRGISREDLAKEALRLRQRRRELENRLGITSQSGSRNDEF